MEESTILGTFQWGGVRYYRVRNFAVGALVAYSYYFFRAGPIYYASYRHLLSNSTWLFVLLGLMVPAFALLRRKVVEEIAVDYERGQVVARRNVFGLQQIIQLANLESIVGVALGGDDFSLRGNKDARWVGYLITDRARAVPISQAAAERGVNNRSELQDLAAKLGVPFHAGGLTQRISVKPDCTVEYLPVPRRLGLFRSVFFIPSMLLVLGFYAAVGMMISFFLIN